MQSEVETTRKCARCDQEGVLIEANHGIFGHAMYFGAKDDWSFIPQHGGTFLCGSCALDEKNDFELAEYGIEKIRLGKWERAYRKKERPQAAVPMSYQDIPMEFRTADLSKIPVSAEEKIRKWYHSQTPQLCIMGDALRSAWAIFRKAQIENIGAQFWRVDELVSRIRNEENTGQSYAGSPTAKAMQRSNGIVIMHDILGINLTQSRAEWIGSILDERLSYKRKTVITIMPMDGGLPTAIMYRVQRGDIVPICAWGHEMLGIPYIPR